MNPIVVCGLILMFLTAALSVWCAFTGNFILAGVNAILFLVNSACVGYNLSV